MHLVLSICTDYQTYWKPEILLELFSYFHKTLLKAEKAGDISPKIYFKVKVRKGGEIILCCFQSKVGGIAYLYSKVTIILLVYDF